VSTEPIFRDLTTNLRTEFRLERIDQGGMNLVERDLFYDLNVSVYPSGSLVNLYDIEWVLMEI